MHRSRCSVAGSTSRQTMLTRCGSMAHIWVVQRWHSLQAIWVTARISSGARRLIGIWWPSSSISYGTSVGIPINSLCITLSAQRAMLRLQQRPMIHGLVSATVPMLLFITLPLSGGVLIRGISLPWLTLLRQWRTTIRRIPKTIKPWRAILIPLPLES